MAAIDEPGVYLSLYFKIEDKAVAYERRAYTLIDLGSELGGLFTFVKLSFQFPLREFTIFAYRFAMLSFLFEASEKVDGQKKRRKITFSECQLFCLFVKMQKRLFKLSSQDE